MAWNARFQTPRPDALDRVRERDLLIRISENFELAEIVNVLQLHTGNLNRVGTVEFAIAPDNSQSPSAATARWDSLFGHVRHNRGFDAY